MIYEEKTVSSQEIYQGKIVTLKVDKVTLPDGKQAERELVLHPGGVGVVAVDEDGSVILVRQFRKPLEDAIYEIPAGKLDKGEDHRLCGIRELAEETGYRAEEFVYLGYIYPSPGFTDEVTHIYLATGLSQGECHPDEDEYLDVVRMPFEDAVTMVMENKINDAKTVAGILKAKNMLG
ncbi:MAG: NUDIX hydrolase [Clostridia bacterium]|nr:NUDIX hydrolase [Clostridia bacterium]